MHFYQVGYESGVRVERESPKVSKHCTYAADFNAGQSEVHPAKSPYTLLLLEVLRSFNQLPQTMFISASYSPDDT